MKEGWWLGVSVAWKGASSRIAAYSERQPISGLCAITRLPGRKTRPCVSWTVKTDSSLDCTKSSPRRLSYYTPLLEGLRGSPCYRSRGPAGGFLLSDHQWDSADLRRPAACARRA